MSKEKLSRRDFLKIAGLGLGGAVVGRTLSALIDKSGKNNIQIELAESTHQPTAKVDSLTIGPSETPTDTATVSKQTVTPEPENTATPENTVTPEPTEVPKEYEFKIGEVRLDLPFLLELPGKISGDLGYPNGLEVPIYEPVANRQKIGWPSEMDTIYRNYQEHPQSALVAQTEIPGHDVLNLHSFSYGDKLLPGEVFRRVKDRDSLKGTRFQVTQIEEDNSVWVKSSQVCSLEIVDVTAIEGSVFESSVGRPSESYGPQKFVFFRTDMWNLNEGDKARQPNQVTFVTCDGRYVEDNLSKFATRLLITAELTT